MTSIQKFEQDFPAEYYVHFHKSATSIWQQYHIQYTAVGEMVS